MKAKIISFVFFLFLTILIIPNSAYAEENSSGKSANFAGIIVAQKSDHRVEILKRYLEKMDSPLAQYAQDFVVQADAYTIPWDLVPAISGTESTLGKQAPANCNNYYGFGIYTNHMTCFDSVQEGIKTVSQALRENYMDKWHAQTIEDIGSIYASSPMWAIHTQFFIQQMEDFKQQYENQSLSLSI